MESVFRRGRESHEAVELNESQRETLQEMKRRFAAGKFSQFAGYPIPREYTESHPELAEEFLSMLLDNFRRGRARAFLLETTRSTLLLEEDDFELGMEFINPLEIAEDRVLIAGSILISKEMLSRDEVQDALKFGIESWEQSASFRDVDEFVAAVRGLSPFFSQDSDNFTQIRKVLAEGLFSRISPDTSPDTVGKFMERYSLDVKDASLDAQESFKAYIPEVLGRDLPGRLESTIRTLMDSSDVRESCRRSVFDGLKKKKGVHWIARATSVFRDIFSTEELIVIAEESILSLADQGDFLGILKATEISPPSRAFLESEAGRESAEKGVMSALRVGRIDHALSLARVLKSPLERSLERASRIFPDFLDESLWNQFNALLNGAEVPGDFLSLGVKKTGDAGVLELERALRARRDAFLASDVGVEELRGPVTSAVFKGLTRFSYSEFGAHSIETWRKMVDEYERYLISEERVSLDPKYVASEAVNVRTVGELKDFVFSKGFLDRFATISLDIAEAATLVSAHPEGGFGRELVASIEGKLRQRMSVCREKHQRYTAIVDGSISADADEVKSAPFARKNLEKEMGNITFVLDNAESLRPQELFRFISDIPGIESELRRIVFALSLHINPSYLEHDFSQHVRDPDQPAISRVIEFVDHITNRETFAQYFEDRATLKKFQSLLNVSALMQELGRMADAQSDSVGTVPFKFIPSRDFKTELSGHMADACWANTRESTLASYPNIASLTFVQNPEHEVHRRVAGAMILIESVSKDGSPLLIMRGINPIENVANGVNVEDFFNQLVGYLKPIASALGRKLAVVIDDHAVGSASNRPVVFNFLSAKAPSLQPIELASAMDSTFNGYDITNKTFLVDGV